MLFKIGILSDTHSHLDDAVYNFFDQVDEIWHAGDIGNIEIADKLADFKPLRAVYGNIDNHIARSAFPEFNRFIIDKTDVLINHTGGYPGRYSPQIKEIMKKNPPEILVCGHSHILKIMFDKKNNCLFINPGAAGKHGIHEKITLIRFEIELGEFKNLEIYERLRNYK